MNSHKNRQYKPVTRSGKLFQKFLPPEYHHYDIILPLVAHIYENAFGRKLMIMDHVANIRVCSINENVDIMDNEETMNPILDVIFSTYMVASNNRKNLLGVLTQEILNEYSLMKKYQYHVIIGENSIIVYIGDVRNNFLKPAYTITNPLVAYTDIEKIIFIPERTEIKICSDKCISLPMAERASSGLDFIYTRTPVDKYF
jgi:hypothetical protein